MESAASYIWDDACMQQISKYLTVRETDFIQRAVPAATGQTALDIGCGTGKYVQVLEQLGYTTTGVEYDIAPLTLIQQRKPGTQIVQADGQHLPFADSVFDVVAAIQVQDYFPQRSLFFSDVWRVLKPGGMFLVTMTNKRSIKGLIYNLYLAWNRRSRSARFYEQPLTSCLDELKEQPFTVEQIWGYNWNLLARDCDSSFKVGCFAAMEKTLRLEKIPNLSPVAFVVARKKA